MGDDATFIHFSTDIRSLPKPEKFTYPFFYVPHPLVEVAAEELKVRIQADPDILRGLESGNDVQKFGKMLGVLIVENAAGQLGYLAAFSGKFAHENVPNFFVPAVANIHASDSHYKRGEAELNEMTAQISALKSSPEQLALDAELDAKKIEYATFVADGRARLKAEKKDRESRRKSAKSELNATEFETFNDRLREESISTQVAFKHQSARLKDELDALQTKWDAAKNAIKALENNRREKSNGLQRWIFDQYQFLNNHGQKQALTTIFPNFETERPPSGSGDCCAPKLLQHAYLQGYKPLAMGEFWWGPEPKNEVRKAGNFYPSCNSRCRPILGHMLEGLEVEENPLLSWSDDLELPIIYDDADIVIVNKPEGMLSVPGKDIIDSAFTRIQHLYPEATGSILLHRLDMSTSGILVFTKSPKAHKFIQHQFIARTVKKRYIAIVDGTIAGDRGTIELPLRPDYYDLPRQLVCHEHGKPAKTHWEVLERKDGKTRLALYPHTGRTHQLRVHCAHPEGLNTPIFGDELYGKPQNRLHLHAEHITFIHPTTKEEISFTVAPNF